MSDVSGVIWFCVGMIFAVVTGNLALLFRSILSSRCQHFAALALRICCKRRAILEDVEFSMLVSQRVSARRAALAADLCKLMRVILSMACFVLALQLVRGGVVDARFIAFLTPFLIMASLVPVIPQRRASGMLLLLLHVFAMMILCAASMTQDFANEGSFYTIGNSLLQWGAVFASLLCLRYEVVFLTNLGLLICVSAAYASKEPLTWYAWFPSGRIGSNLLLFIGKMGFLYGIDAFIKVGARAEMQGRLGRLHQSAVSSLLGLMCDAVLDVDHLMSMKDHAPKFANLLMHGSGRSLAGESLVGFVSAGEDREAFERAMDLGSGEPHMFTTRLRDAIGNLVNVVVYHVPYASLGGKTHHLLGVREDGDVWGWPRAPAPSVERSAGPRSGPGLPEAVLRPDIAEQLGANGGHALAPSAQSLDLLPPIANAASIKSGDSSSSASSGGSSTSGIFGANRRPRLDMCAKFELTSEMRVECVGQGLLSKLGLKQGEIKTLRDVLPEGDLNFPKWLLTTANEAFYGGKTAAFVAKYGEITLTRAAPGGGVVKGVGFVQFEWPLFEGDGVTDFVILGISSGPRAAPTMGRGTSATSVPTALQANGGHTLAPAAQFLDVLPPTANAASIKSWDSSSSASRGGSSTSGIFGASRCPRFDMCVKLELTSEMRVEWVGQGLLNQLGLRAGELKTLRDVLPLDGLDFAKWLTGTANEAFHSDKTGPFVAEYGDIELTRAGNGGGVVKGLALVHFEWPLLADDGGTDFVTLGIRSGPRAAPTIGGTSATSVPSALQFTADQGVIVAL